MSNKASAEPDFKMLFEQVPGLYMVLDPNLRIVAASDAYLHATLTRREDIIGRYVFEVFPDNPDDPSSDAMRNSLASFNRVLQTHETDVMVVQRHDVRRPESEGGGFETRYWSSINSPVLNPDGSLAYILHRVENVTDYVLLKQQGVEQAKMTDEMREQTMKMEADLYERSHEVAEASLKLKQANAGQAHLLDLAHVLIRDLNDCIISWNTGAETLYGFSKEEAIGRVSHDLLKTVFPISKEAMAEAIATTGHWQGELVHTAKDGHKVVVASHQIMHRDEYGKPLAIIEVNNDVTERKKAEEALRISEDKFAKAFATNPAAIAMTRLEDGLFIDINDTWLSLTGYSRDEAIGHSAREMNIWPTREAAARFVEELKEEGSIHGWEQEFYKKSGEIYVAQLSGQILVINGETVVLSTLVDITERKRAEEMLKARATELQEANSKFVDANEELACANEELRTTTEELQLEILERKRADEALRESEQRFRTMADAIPPLAWMADPDGFIFWYNQRWYEYTGTTPEQMEGWGWQNVHDPEMLPKVLEKWQASIATGEPFDMEFPLLGADGKFRIFLTRVMPMKDSEGRVIRWFGTNTDVSEAREVEAHKLEFYQRTILAATNGKLVITEQPEIERIAGPALASWEIRTPDGIKVIRHGIEETARSLGIEDPRLGQLVVAVGEAVTNTVKHAGQGEASIHSTDDSLIVVVSDHGPGIPALALPDVALTEGYSTAGTLGMGYKLMMRFADKVYLATGAEGTTVGIELKLHPAELTADEGLMEKLAGGLS